MEQEYFCSGYCRMLDRSRTVTVLVVDRALEEVDCCYGSCIHRPNCPIAQKIDDIKDTASRS